MSAPFNLDDLHQQIEAEKLAASHRHLARISTRIEQIALPVLLTVAAVLGAISLMSQATKWIAL